MHWIINTAPLFLGLVASLVGMRQARLEVASADLERRGEERTSELGPQIAHRAQIEEELRQAVSEARAATELKGEFMATMSHEIRTPLNGVIGMTGLLFNTELTKEQKEFTQTIQNSSEVLLSVINDILDFSKLEAGKVVLESISFDVRTAVKDTLDLVRHLADEKGISLNTEINESVPDILHGDPVRIRQVLLNLVSNAIKFTAQGQVSVQVSSEPLPQDRVHLLIGVQDSGIGIAEDRVTSLFTAFAQADPSTTRRYGGTGLGLSIAKSLVALMGGNIGVESVKNKGSRFWFALPLSWGRAMS